MLYAEAAYFDGNHCQHCATRDEAKRLARIEANNRRALRERRTRSGSRAR